MHTLTSHRDLTRETVEAVAWGGEKLALALAALERVAAGQAELAALLAGGERVYGVSTGTGWLASVDLGPDAQADHQRNLLLGRAVGGPPWLAPAEARAVLVARLGNLLSGHTGVGPELCRFLVDRVNDGFVPAVPRRGVGCAGEVIPLAHACQTLVGAGLVLGPDGAARDAAAALADRRVAPHRLEAKEGIALLAGSPVATALALARLRAGERLAGQLLASAAAAVDALRAPLDPYDAAVGRLAGDPLLEEVLADLRRAAGGREAGPGRREADSGRRGAGSGQREAGSGQGEAGPGKWEAGAGQREAGPGAVDSDEPPAPASATLPVGAPDPRDRGGARPGWGAPGLAAPGPGSRQGPEGPGPGRAGSVLQAPVSFRVAPQVLAQLRRTLGRLDEDVRRALGAVTDSPALVGGRVVAGGGFHAVGVAAGMDGLAVALVQAAELAAQRLHRLLDGRFSGLPDQLSPDPGPVTGLVVVHKRAVGAVHEARRLAGPASVGQADTSLGQEDAASFAPEASEQLRRVEELVREVVACELLAARQAWWLRRTGAGSRRDGPAAGLRPLAARLEDLVAPVDRDRPLGPDLDRLVEALEGDKLPLP